MATGHPRLVLAVFILAGFVLAIAANVREEIIGEQDIGERNLNEQDIGEQDFEDNQVNIELRSGHTCHFIGGRCIGKADDCPSDRPFAEPVGLPYCSKNKKCCVAGTTPGGQTELQVGNVTSWATRAHTRGDICSVEETWYGGCTVYSCNTGYRCCNLGVRTSCCSYNYPVCCDGYCCPCKHRCAPKGQRACYPE